MTPNRSNSVIVALLAAIIVPRIQKWTGVTLGIDDVAQLFAAAILGWHAAAATFEKYFPPPSPPKQ